MWLHQRPESSLKASDFGRAVDLHWLQDWVNSSSGWHWII
jgi:hypothetical protein